MKQAILTLTAVLISSSVFAQVTSPLQASPNAKEKTWQENLLLKQKHRALKTGKDLEIYSFEKRVKMAESEGSGTRGGGSGVAFFVDGALAKVEVLDLYRSNNRSVESAFSAIDPTLAIIGDGQNPEYASERILDEVLNRTSKLNSRLANGLAKIRQDLPFAKWTPASRRLEMIPDFVGELKLTNEQRHVQIASRRAKFIIYDRQLYARMDALNRAALKLHEFAYALSGGTDGSASIQRFVSSLFSADLKNGTQDKLKNTLIELGLDSLSQKFEKLPEGAKLLVDKTRRLVKGNACGNISNLKFNSEGKTVTLRISYSREVPDIRQRDIINHAGNSVDRALTAITYLQQDQFTLPLDHETTLRFLQSFYFAKSYLSGKYAHYFYPKKSIPVDFICFDMKRNKLLQLETAYTYDPKLNDLELKAAEIESKIVALQTKADDSNDLTRKTADEATIAFAKAELVKINEAIAERSANAFSWLGTAPLEQVIIAF